MRICGACFKAVKAKRTCNVCHKAFPNMGGPKIRGYETRHSVSSWHMGFFRDIARGKYHWSIEYLPKKDMSLSEKAQLKYQKSRARKFLRHLGLRE